MKKASPFLVVVFAALTAVFIAAGPVMAKMVAVKNENVNMRSGPSTKNKVLWKLGKGFPLKVLRRSGSWYKVRDFEGATGWIHRSVVNSSGHMIVKKRKINIRSRPTTRSRVVAKANYGVVFKTLKKTKNWVKVQHSDLTGWISRNLLWGF
jgi:SH3-like domain-containing protein